MYRKRNPQFEGSYGDYYNYGGMALSDTNSKGVQSIENGFKVFANKSQSLYTNQSDETYMYIAIVGGERKDIGWEKGGIYGKYKYIKRNSNFI